MGPSVTAKTQLRNTASIVPPELMDVALIDAHAAAAAGSMSLSWWHAEVAAGRAPAPVLRRSRCTRWRLLDVAAFWLAFGDRADASAAEALKDRANKASAAARAKRVATDSLAGT